MELRHLNEFCSSHLVASLPQRFSIETQRSLSLQVESKRAVKKGIVLTILTMLLFIIPSPPGDPRYLAIKIVLGFIAFIQLLGVLSYMRRYKSFTRSRTLDDIQAFYSSIFLQTTDKYRTTPRDRNRSLKKALQDNFELFPYPLYNHYIKDGHKIYLYEWNEILRMYPLWKINILAIRILFTNIKVGNVKFIKIEVDYRIEEELKTFVLYNAIVELSGLFFLVSPYPYTEE